MLVKHSSSAMNCLTTICVIVAFCYLEIASGRPSSDDTLLLVHTLFRHGNRAPDSRGYKNNPIANDSFYQPYGYSQLTNEGKRTEYRIGTSLRRRYNRFLGPTWNIHHVEARTTNVNRTKMSLELVLAGLYPPVGQQKWRPWLRWQPIPYNYLNNDKELFGNYVCSNYETLLEEVLNSPEIQEALSVYNDVFEYVSKQTGESFNTPESIFGLYFNLLTQEEYGYPLEDWLAPVWPDKLEKIAKEAYYLGTNTTDLKKLGGGYLLKKIINDSKAKIDGLLVPESRKAFLYSAHERNVANFLIVLGVFNDQIPSYGSHVIVELHRVKGVYGFKIFYQDWSTPEPKLLVVPGCTAFCPFDEFVSIYEEVIPDDDFCKH